MPRTEHLFCVGCEKTLRPRRRKEAEFPGTVEHHGHGLCSRCYHLNRPGHRGNDAPEDEDVIILFERMKQSTGLTKEEIMYQIRKYGV